MLKLKFAKGNAKLGKDTAVFSLPAGHTCPGAKDCLAKANRDTGAIATGKQAVFRCYAVSQENLFRNVRVSRWRNFEALKGLDLLQMFDLIMTSFPRKVKLCRIHGSGDFFNDTYFQAWIMVARNKPDVTFYAYTKMLHFWVKHKSFIPSNLHLNASRGGMFDALIDKHGLKSVEVVFSKADARKKGLKLDHDDTLAYSQDKSFALLLHGTQPKNSLAAKAWQKIKATFGGYKADYFSHYAKQSANKNLKIRSVA